MSLEMCGSRFLCPRLFVPEAVARFHRARQVARRTDATGRDDSVMLHSQTRKTCVKTKAIEPLHQWTDDAPASCRRERETHKDYPETGAKMVVEHSLYFYARSSGGVFPQRAVQNHTRILIPFFPSIFFEWFGDADLELRHLSPM